MDLSCQTHPIHGRQTLHNLQGQLLSTFQFFICVLNSFKDVQFLYSDCNEAKEMVQCNSNHETEVIDVQ